jgi:uncharacterized membrane protein YdbT with pleckstrin-like domain
MSRRVKSLQPYEDPLVPLTLFVGGALALCLAVLYPFQQVLWGLTPADLLTMDLVVTSETVGVSLALAAVAVVATLYGLVTLLLQL